MNHAVRLTGALTALAVMLGAAGCARKTVKRGDTTITTAGIEDGRKPPDEPEPSVRNARIEAVPHLETIHFDFDSSKLSKETLEILVKNASWLKENPEAKVQVAGHCDQRGTVGYNLALGQRRAKAVRDTYRRLGVSGRRIATISYGEEKPACAEESEGCWLSNRRAETLMLVPKTNVKGPQGSQVMP